MSWLTVLVEFDLPRLEALNTFWKVFPPVHVMVRRALKIETKSTPSESEDDGELQAFMATFDKH